VALSLAEHLYGENPTRELRKLNSNDVKMQLKKGSNVIDGVTCDMFSIVESDKKRIYVGVTPMGKWYIDEENTGDYSAVKGFEGYVDDEGETETEETEQEDEDDSEDD
jgi:hypothetical protein